MEAKAKSPTYRAFVGIYGITDAYELEALAPCDLVSILKDAIEQVVDLDLFNQELASEEADSTKIIAIDSAARIPWILVTEVGLALKKLLLERLNWRKITIDHARLPENPEEA